MFAHIWMRKMEVTKSSNKYRPKEVGKPATWRTNLNAPSRQNRRIKARKIDFASNVHCTNSLPLFLLQECVFVSLLVFFSIRNSTRMPINVMPRPKLCEIQRFDKVSPYTRRLSKNHRISLIYEYSIMQCMSVCVSSTLKMVK